MEIYKTVSAFIRFSGLDTTFKEPIEEIIVDTLNNKDPIDFEVGKALVRIYSSNSKKSDMKQIITFCLEVQNKYDNIILIKNTWNKLDVAKVKTIPYFYFEQDVGAINYKFKPKVLKEDTSLNFHKIKKELLPKISVTDPLAVWLLAEVGDIISYEIVTENGPAISKRLVV